MSQYEIIIISYFAYTIPALFFVELVFEKKLKYSKMNAFYKIGFFLCLPVFLVRKVISLGCKKILNSVFS